MAISTNESGPPEWNSNNEGMYCSILDITTSYMNDKINLVSWARTERSRRALGALSVELVLYGRKEMT